MTTRSDLDLLKETYPVSPDVARLNSTVRKKRTVQKGNPASAVINNPAKLKKLREAVGIKGLRLLDFTIAHLPYRELSPNSRVHWAVKARAVKAQREEVAWLMKVRWHNQTPMAYATISYDFKVTNNRHRDIDNLVSSCKSFQDGLVDAGVILKDDSEHLSVGISIITRGMTERTKIRVEEILV